MTCTEDDILALRVKTEHQTLLDAVVKASKDMKNRLMRNPGLDPTAAGFGLLVEAETNLVMFECANDLPLTDWTKYTR